MRATSYGFAPPVCSHRRRRRALYIIHPPHEPCRSVTSPACFACCLLRIRLGGKAKGREGKGMEPDAATRRFNLWFRGLRSLRRDLKSARWSADAAQLSALVGRFVAHLESYCAARVELDPVRTLSAPWATPPERGAAYWLAGWRPSTLVQLLYTESGSRFEAQLPDLLIGVRSGNLGDLSPAQLAQIDDLQRRTVADEDARAREMARVQEGRGVVGASGDEVDVAAVVERVRAVLGGADALRLRTMRRAVEILEPAQAAELLVAAADMEIGFREFGLKYVADRDE